ncbi:MAG: fibronectin type III domain-containing protein, partial [Rhodobacteraceae bacterium]|nr:fibronectin type III domain-containing protein [Paracoccaceae bacterium]
MPLQRSGRISLLDIAEEFDEDYDDNLPYALTDFYAGGSYVRAGTRNDPSSGSASAIPASGAISLTDFYGAARTAGAVIVAPATLTVAEGGSATISVRLSAQPPSTVTVTLTESSSKISRTPATRRFTRTNWNRNQTFTITGLQDTDIADETATVTLTASGGITDTHTVTVTVTDDDGYNPPRSLTFSQISDDFAVARWLAPTGGSLVPIGYTVELKLRSQCWSDPPAPVDITVLVNNFPSLSASTTYDFRVRARYAGGNNSDWIDGSFTTLAEPPALPAAVAPSVSVTNISSIDEDETATLVASVSGGTYDTLSYEWTASHGTITGSGRSVTYNPPNVSSRTRVTVNCEVTARGTGTNALNNTSDQDDDNERFWVEPVVEATFSIEIYRVSGPASPAPGDTVRLGYRTSGTATGTVRVTWSGGGTGSTVDVTRSTEGTERVTISATRGGLSDTDSFDVEFEYGACRYSGWSDWSPATSTVCEGVALTQARTRTLLGGNPATCTALRETRSAVGTQDCSRYPAPTGASFTEAADQLIFTYSGSTTGARSRNGQPTAFVSTGYRQTNILTLPATGAVPDSGGTVTL